MVYKGFDDIISFITACLLYCQKKDLVYSRNYIIYFSSQYFL